MISFDLMQLFWNKRISKCCEDKAAVFIFTLGLISRGDSSNEKYRAFQTPQNLYTPGGHPTPNSTTKINPQGRYRNSIPSKLPHLT
jgi:hypothetical protein